MRKRPNIYRANNTQKMQILTKDISYNLDIVFSTMENAPKLELKW